ncbi:MAG: helix-turn-helix transcriptional regulator [Dehalococcoidales bacterium]|nr:helix-turn-helix transcriptional regulator [Dehalococcoidales bacterium]
MNFGEKVKLLREKKGLSPERLAMFTTSEKDPDGLTGGYIRKIESGAVKSPTLDTANALARGLGVPVSALIDTEELPDKIVKDMGSLAIKSFIENEYPGLDNEEKEWVKRSIQMVRERHKEKYQVEKRK